MRKKKYGEDTVVMRVPRSFVPKVKDLLKSAEVLGSPSSASSPFDEILDGFTSAPLKQQLIRSYQMGFDAGEEFQVCQQLELSGHPESIPVVMKSFRSRQVSCISHEFVQAVSKILPETVYLQGSARNLRIGNEANNG